MIDISGTRVAILATNGFEQSELEVPRDRLKAAGAAVDIVALESGQIRGWDHKDWGRSVSERGYRHPGGDDRGRHSKRPALALEGDHLSARGRGPGHSCSSCRRGRNAGDPATRDTGR